MFTVFVCADICKQHVLICASPRVCSSLNIFTCIFQVEQSGEIMPFLCTFQNILLSCKMKNKIKKKSKKKNRKKTGLLMKSAMRTTLSLVNTFNKERENNVGLHMRVLLHVAVPMENKSN